MLPYPVLPSELPEAFKLLHPEKKLLVSVRAFPWGIAVGAGPGCGDANRELRSPSFRFWQTFPAPDRRMTGTGDPPSGIPGVAAGQTPPPKQIAGAQGASALLPHSFRAWRRIPFPAHKSLYAPVAPARVTPAPQIINGGGRPSLFFFSPLDLFSPRAVNPAENPPDGIESHCAAVHELDTQK